MTKGMPTYSSWAIAGKEARPMRSLTWLIPFLLLTIGGLAAFSWTNGQEGLPAPVQPAQATQPTGDLQKIPQKSSPLLPASISKDVASMPPLKRHFYLSAQSGADWLVRTN